MNALDNVGPCRSCGGILDVMTAHLPTIVVVCTECCDRYAIFEPEAESAATDGEPETNQKGGGNEN